jgi:hypothetical protein
MDKPSSASVILPDSRLRHPKGVVRGDAGFGSINWVPVFCANCGKPHGYVPEENCNFTAWLCDPCADKYGEQYGVALAPDEVFWQKVSEEMLDRYGRCLTREELQKLAEASCAGPLSTLLREGA